MKIKYSIPDGTWQNLNLCPNCGHVYCNRDYLGGHKICPDCGESFKKLIAVPCRYVDTSYSKGWFNWVQQGHWEYKYPTDLNIENAIRITEEN